ncbi:MAG: hypothetical protein NWR72_00515 [Bacteroidia bacterium]|nr:hypothetical protein [Bacteroidia bacterium]
MKSLNADWFVEGTLDFEYKKYVLLAYLQHVSREFADYRLYPALAELVAHHNALLNFREQRHTLSKQFPRELDHEAFKQLKLDFHAPVSDSSIHEIDSIIDYSIPKIKINLQEGIGRFEEVENTLNIEPIGITPLYTKEGYFFVRQEPDPAVAIYEYKVLFLEHVNGNLHGIHVDQVDTQVVSLTHTYEHIKWHLVKQRKQLPNPATFLVRASLRFPQQEAVLPVVKRRMLTMLKSSL